MNGGGIFGKGVLGSLGASAACETLADVANETCNRNGLESQSCRDTLAALEACMAGEPETSTPPTPPTTSAATTPITGACTSSAVKMGVQTILGVPADGNWGAKSQTALQASGRTFKQIAPNCSGNAPSYGAITGGTPTATPPTSWGGPSPWGGSSEQSSGLMSKPITWIALALLGVGGYILLTKKEKGGAKTRKSMRRNRRRTSRKY